MSWREVLLVVAGMLVVGYVVARWGDTTLFTIKFGVAS